MSKIATDLLLSSYRDSAKLPLIDGVNNRKALFFGSSVYLIAAATFVVMVYSYYVFDSLKTQVSTFTRTSNPTNENCETISTGFYFCTSLQLLSTLNILAQSLSLTTAVIGILFFASLVYLMCVAYQKSAVFDLLTITYRDDGDLPLVGNISKGKAYFVGAAIYGIAMVAFMRTVVSYNIFDSLKTEVVTISTTNTGPNCKILSSVTHTYNINGSPSLDANPLITFIKETSHSFCGSDEYNTIQFDYNLVYFTSYDQCLETVNIQPVISDCVAVSCPGPYGPCYRCPLYGNGGISITIFWLQNIATQSHTTPSTPPCFNSTGDNIPLTPAIVCSPYKNYPPFQCTTLEPLSTFNIVSQGLSIATTTIGVLFLLTSLWFKQRSADHASMRSDGRMDHASSS